MVASVSKIPFLNGITSIVNTLLQVISDKNINRDIGSLTKQTVGIERNFDSAFRTLEAKTQKLGTGGNAAQDNAEAEALRARFADIVVPTTEPVAVAKSATLQPNIPVDVPSSPNFEPLTEKQVKINEIFQDKKLTDGQKYLEYEKNNLLSSLAPDFAGDLWRAAQKEGLIKTVEVAGGVTIPETEYNRLTGDVKEIVVPKVATMNPDIEKFQALESQFNDKMIASEGKEMLQGEAIADFVDEAKKIGIPVELNQEFQGIYDKYMGSNVEIAGTNSITQGEYRAVTKDQTEIPVPAAPQFERASELMSMSDTLQAEGMKTSELGVELGKDSAKQAASPSHTGVSEKVANEIQSVDKSLTV